MAILPRYRRLRRRDWKDPFSWFHWQQIVVATTRWNAGNSVLAAPRLAENGTTRLAENTITRLNEGY